MLTPHPPSGLGIYNQSDTGDHVTPELHKFQNSAVIMRPSSRMRRCDTLYPSHKACDASNDAFFMPGHRPFTVRPSVIFWLFFGHRPIIIRRSSPDFPPKMCKEIHRQRDNTAPPGHLPYAWRSLRGSRPTSPLFCGSVIERWPADAR